MNNETKDAREEDGGPRIGIFDGITNSEYHNGPGISKSGLDIIDQQSPLHYITQKRHPKNSTPAQIIGQAFHCLTLEPDAFEKEYVMEPDDAPWRPTSTQINAKKPSHATLSAIAFWESWERENFGKVILTNKPGSDPFWSPGDWDRIHRMRDAVMEHPIAGVLLDPDQGKAEQSVYWIDTDTRNLCRCRPDFMNRAHNVCVDLKSTIDASYTGFGKSSANYRYHVQDAFYTDGLKAVGEKPSDMVFIAAEKNPPYAVACYIVGSDRRGSTDQMIGKLAEQRRVARLIYKRNLATYAECHASGEWRSYPDEIRDLELPAWGLRGHIS